MRQAPRCSECPERPSASERPDVSSRCPTSRPPSLQSPGGERAGVRTMVPDILIIDDSLTVRTDLQSALAAAGYRATACSSMAAAKQELDRKPFALVILDVVLPDGDGLELLRDLKADPDRAS